MSKVNQSDFLGSLRYNLNELTGYIAGDPDPESVHKYSDIYASVTGKRHYISDEISDIAERIDDGLYSPDYLTQRWGGLAADEMDPDTYLLGLTFLPWFAAPEDPLIPGTFVKRRGRNGDWNYNKASSAVLVPTMLTVVKIGGVAVGSFYVVKYGYKYIKKR